MAIQSRLRDLARNLYWTWHPDVAEIFRDLDPSLWREVNHNPVELLSRVPDEMLEEKAVELAQRDRRVGGAMQEDPPLALDPPTNPPSPDPRPPAPPGKPNIPDPEPAPQPPVPPGGVSAMSSQV